MYLLRSSELDRASAAPCTAAASPSWTGSDLPSGAGRDCGGPACAGLPRPAPLTQPADGQLLAW